MSAFIIRRLLLGIIVLFVVTFFVFLLIHLTPGDPVLTMLGPDAGLKQIAELRAKLWLDRPFIVQYSHWLSNIFRGDFGNSILLNESVTKLIAERLPITVYLSVTALLISVVVGVTAGIICAIRRGGILDSFVTLFANMGIAIPIFWLGILGIYGLGLKLGWLPIQGFTSPLDNFWLSVKQTIMPIICLSITGIAVLARQSRSSMLEVIHQDYIRTAWSKGIPERIIVYRHALKNALIPIVTLLGSQFRTLIGGSVIVETVFNIPGMGRLLIRGVFDKDFLIVQSVVLVMAVLVLIINLLVDISYGWLDPKIRYQ